MACTINNRIFFCYRLFLYEEYHRNTVKFRIHRSIFFTRFPPFFFFKSRSSAYVGLGVVVGRGGIGPSPLPIGLTLVLLVGSQVPVGTRAPLLLLPVQRLEALLEKSLVMSNINLICHAEQQCERSELITGSMNTSKVLFVLNRAVRAI